MVQSRHATPERISKLSLREARAEARTKLKHDRDAAEVSTSAKLVKWKGKEIARDNDFVEEEVIPKPTKTNQSLSCWQTFKKEEGSKISSKHTPTVIREESNIFCTT
nr:uncharacterized protein LOC117278886 [Nicotiana tomentosiformis]